MTRRAAPFAIVALAIACSKVEPPRPRPAPAPSERTAGRVETRTHRKDAGEPDASGWCEARSTRGGFAVQLPTSFDDTTVTMPAPDGSTLVAETIGASTEHGTRFTASRTRRSDGRILVSSPDEVAERLEKDGKLVSKAPVHVAGRPGVEVRSRTESGLGRLRILIDGGTLYQVGVEYSPDAAPASIEADIAKFFDSFRIEGPGEE